MVVIFDKKSGAVVSSLSGNMCFGDSMPEMIERMFPSIFEQLSYCEIPVMSLPCGAVVETKHGIVVRISSGDEEFYKIDPTEWQRRLHLQQTEERQQHIAGLPYRSSKELGELISRRLPELRQTEPEIAASLSDNSYFSKPVQPVGWWGSFTDAGGYANMNREIVQRLHNHHFLPHISIYPTLPQVDQYTQSTLKLFSRLKPRSYDCPYVYAFTPMEHGRHPGHRIFFTMMETSTLHRDFAKYCNQYSDEVWVPSHQNRDLFAGNGVKKPIRVVPLGIDELLYFGTEKRDFPLGDCHCLFGRPPSKGVAGFRFLTVIQWNFRKGFDALIKSFVNAFTDKDDVCLVIATQYPAELVRGDLAGFLPRTDNLPQVLLYNAIIPISMMPGIYDVCDCYVHLSRGEGFSLTQIEGAARGLPVISCCHSGMTEYLREDNSYPIYCKEREKCHPLLARISYFYQGQSLWKVGSKQIDAATEIMRSVVDDPTEAREKAAILQKEVHDNFTWKKAVKRVAEALRS